MLEDPKVSKLSIQKHLIPVFPFSSTVQTLYFIEALKILMCFTSSNLEKNPQPKQTEGYLPTEQRKDLLRKKYTQKLNYTSHTGTD